MNKQFSSKSIFIYLPIIIVFGLIILASATTVLGFNQFNDNFYYFKHQIFNGLIPGLVLFFICSRLPLTFWKKFAGLIFIFALLLVLAVFIPGVGQSYEKAQSWISLGGVSFQPSEFLKMALIIYLAALFSNLKDKHSLNEKFLGFILILLCISVPIILQPDLGTLIVIILIALGMYFIAGASLKNIFFLLFFGALGFGAMVMTASYRIKRFLAFLHPEQDMQGYGYHIIQSLTAVGSGGLLGLGLGKSRQKFEYLPQVEGDSIFAIMAEEIGFIFCALFLILILLFIIKLFKFAFYQSNDFNKFLISGIALWIATQTLINIGAMLGVLPLTGVPLPFISYGGTALMSLMAGMGIVYRIMKN